MRRNGEDYFRLAEKMEMLGITLYYGALGVAYFYTAEILALAESAAAASRRASEPSILPRSVFLSFD